MSVLKTEFNLDSLADESLKSHFQNILQRGGETLNSLRDYYRKDDKVLDVRLFFYDSRFLNAFAAKEGDVYLLGISAATLPLVTALFKQIFSLPFVLPELETSEIDFQNNVSFSFDKKHLSPEVDSAARLSDERAFLATLLADLCTDFILLHEIGHIACGHVEGNAYLTGENTFIEFSGFQKKGKFIRKAWEYEADVIGCMLIVQHLDSLAKMSGKIPHLQKIFLGSQDELALRARLIALLNVALFTLFIYKNRLCLEFGNYSSHPPPLARINYVKNFIARRAERDWGIDIRLVEEFQDEYLDQFLQALEKISSFDCEKIMDDFEDELDRSTKQTEKCFRRFRRYCEKWCWIPKESWS